MLLLDIARDLDAFAVHHLHSSEPVSTQHVRRLLTRFAVALIVQSCHDRRLLHDLCTIRRETIPKTLSRSDALIGPLFDTSALWGPRSCRQFAALGYAMLRFFHYHIRHLGTLTDGGFAANSGMLRLCQLLSNAASEYVFLLHKPLAQTVGKGLLIEGGRNPLIHSREYFEATLQSFYRDVPRLMYFDYQPQASAPILRTAIELKLREAIGIGAFELPSGKLKIISVRQIIAHRSALHLESVVPLAHVLNIYQWTNFSLHGGHRPALSLLWFCFDYLTPFLRGARIRDVVTSNPVWSNLDDDELEAVLRATFDIPADARGIGVERQRGPGRRK